MQGSMGRVIVMCAQGCAGAPVGRDSCSWHCVGGPGRRDARTWLCRVSLVVMMHAQSFVWVVGVVSGRMCALGFLWVCRVRALAGVVFPSSSSFGTEGM